MSFRRAVFTVSLAGVLIGFFGGSAWAEGVISKAAEPKILDALKPHAPGQVVVAPWRIKNIVIVHDRVEVELVTEQQATIIQLVPRGQSRNPRAQSQSFDVVYPRKLPASDKATFEAAGGAIVRALKKGDSGGFFVRVGKKGSKEGGESSQPEPMEPSTPLLPIAWVLFLGILAAYCLALVGFRRTKASMPSQLNRTDVFVLCGLVALAAGFRLTMGPYSLLHENFHATVLMDQLAGTAAAPRPMAGMAGINQLLDVFLPFSFDRLFALMVLMSVIQPLLVFAIARSMTMKRRASWIAGLLVATAPLYIRLASSELAFVPGTTFLLLGIWLSLEGGRKEEPLLLCAAALCVSVAGHFRPVLYTCIVPVAVGALVSVPQPRRIDWLKRPAVWSAAVLFMLLTADDVGPILDSMQEGTALAPGWWQGTGIRSWPVLDPEVTPLWTVLMALASIVVLLWRGTGQKRLLALWSLLVVGWISFWLTSMNGWPSALRYSSAYGWVFAIWIAMAFDRWGATQTRSELIFGGLLIAALVQPLTHQEWIDKHYAPQEELVFQNDTVLPFLAEQEPSLVATPWRELDNIGGSLLAGQVRAMGHRIVPHSLTKSFLDRGVGGQKLYWYRGLSCWARSVKGAGGSYDERGFNTRCKDIEEALSVVPVPGMVFLLEPYSDADWIEIGTGKERVEIGLFLATKR